MIHTTEQLEKMLADATPGPWGLETVTTSCGVCHKIGPWPHQWRGGSEMSACIYDDYPPTISGTANMLANAAIIAAAPTVTAELIAAHKRIADLDALRKPAIHAAAVIGSFYEWVERVEKAGGPTCISGIAECNAMIKSLRKNAKRADELVMKPLREAIAALEAKL